MKLLSITVPAYNCEKTLGNTLESLCVKEVLDMLDIVVVNDGSTDRTASIAHDYAKKYPDSVRVIDKVNGGHGSAVNAGMDAAVGKYFRVVDGDDRLEREGLLALVERLANTNSDLVASPYKKVPIGEGPIVPMAFDGMVPTCVYTFEKLPTNGQIYFGIHSIQIKTSILKENKLRLQEHTFYVDVEYGLLPIPYIKTVEFLDAFLYLYYVGNTGQSISPQNFVKRYEDHYRVLKRMVGFVRSSGAPRAQMEYMISVLRKVCFTNYMLAAFYDENAKRGKMRAKEFDGWLRMNDFGLYQELSKSYYIAFLRLTGFHIFPRGMLVKSLVHSIYNRFKPLFKKKHRLTY